MSVLYLVTGGCPQTEANLRLEIADIREADGDHQAAEQWRAVVAQMFEEWGDPERARVKAALVGGIGPNPNDPVPPLGSPEHPLFWHNPRRDDSIICPCGHFADFLCDEPIGRGRTCDMPACRCCRNQVGPDLDQCPFHASTQPREPRPTLGLVPVTPSKREESAE